MLNNKSNIQTNNQSTNNKDGFLGLLKERRVKVSLEGKIKKRKEIIKEEIKGKEDFESDYFYKRSLGLYKKKKDIKWWLEKEVKKTDNEFLLGTIEISKKVLGKSFVGGSKKDSESFKKMSM